MAVPQEKLQPAQPAPQDLTKEYVVGNGFWSNRIGNILSNFLDDIEWTIGWDVYERMARDPVVSKNLQFQKLSVTSEAVNLHPPVDKKNARFALANDIRDFCDRNLNNLHRPISQIIDEMMVALKRAHSVAEITYNDPSPFGIDPYKLTLKSIKVKPRNTTAFVIDAFRNVLGLTAWTYGNAGVVPSQQMANGQRIIPREKFVVLTFETEDEDPRGINTLRPAYNFWQAKCLVPGLNLKWLEKSAVQSTIGFTSSDAKYEQSFDSEGNPINGEVKSPQEAMAEKLAQLESGSSAAFPNGAAVQTHGAIGDGQQFTRCYSDFDQQIDYAMTLQSGATKDSKNGSRAAKRVFKDVLDVLIWSRKHRVAQALKNDVLKNLVRWNFGEENIDLTPDVVIGDRSDKDWALDAQAAAALGPSLTDSQWIALCQEIGLPAPGEDEELPPRVKSAPSTANTGGSADNPQEQPGEGGPQQ